MPRGSKSAPTVFSTRLEKCVHTNVTIGAIYVCTFRFCALKSYIKLQKHSLPPPAEIHPEK